MFFVHACEYPTKMRVSVGKTSIFKSCCQQNFFIQPQFVISKPAGRGGVRKPPYAFTENGIAMLSSVLKSDRAIQVNIQIMRTFTRLRKLLASHKEILQKLTEHEFKRQELNQNVVKIFEVINAMINPPAEKKKQIGFIPPARTEDCSDRNDR